MNSHEQASGNECPALPLPKPTAILMGCMLKRLGELLNSDAPGVITDEDIEALKRGEQHTRVSARDTNDPPTYLSAPLLHYPRLADANWHGCFKRRLKTPRAPDPILPGETPELPSPNAKHLGEGVIKKRSIPPAESATQRLPAKRNTPSPNSVPPPAVPPAPVPPASAPSLSPTPANLRASRPLTAAVPRPETSSPLSSPTQTSSPYSSSQKELDRLLSTKGVGKHEACQAKLVETLQHEKVAEQRCARATRLETRNALNRSALGKQNPPRPSRALNIRCHRMMRPVKSARQFPDPSSSECAVPIPSEAQSGAERTPTPTRDCAAARADAAVTSPSAPKKVLSSPSQELTDVPASSWVGPKTGIHEPPPHIRGPLRQDPHQPHKVIPPTSAGLLRGTDPHMKDNQGKRRHRHPRLCSRLPHPTRGPRR
jgi:hypothetical protein